MSSKRFPGSVLHVRLPPIFLYGQNLLFDVTETASFRIISVQVAIQIVMVLRDGNICLNIRDTAIRRLIILTQPFLRIALELLEHFP
jgi:hypothetical protein